MVQGMQDIYDQLQQVFAEGIYEGGDNYRKAKNHKTDVENGEEISYSKRGYQKLFFKENVFPPFNESHSEAHELAERWSKSENTQSGERKLISYHNSWYLIEAFDDMKYGYQITRKLTVAEYKKESNYYDTITGYESLQNSLSENVTQHSGRGAHGETGYRIDHDASEYGRENSKIHGLGEEQIRRSNTAHNPARNMSSSSLDSQGENGSSVKQEDIKHSARKGETAEKALSHFGRTFRWSETGYLLIDGAKLDFSGRHEGASGGYRSVDHREILDVYPEDTELDGNGAMVDFMSQGNIRIMPEGNGINLLVQPTKAQEQALSDFISRARGEVTLDIDDAIGNTVVSVEYPKGTYYSKVLQDIRNYFTDGTEPVVSELAKYRFSGRKGEKNTTAEGGVKFSTKTPDVLSNKTITVSMSDSERAQILQGKHLIAPIYKGQADALIKEEEYNLRSDQDKLVKAALVRIGEEFNVFVDYDIKDIDVNITLSRGNLRESVSKKASSSQIAKLLPVLKNAVENAIGVESHKNRYFYDNTTISFDNLIGGYVEGEYFAPVRFGLKHIRGGEVTLYVVIDQQKIKAEVLKPITQNDGSTGSRSACSINIAQIIPFVNSKDLLRYLPDDMLSSEQKEIKWEGIAETIIYTNNKNDQKYKKFIDAGNMQAAKMMVDAAAKAAGYTIKAYHGTTNRQEKSRWNPNTRSWDTEYQRITVFKRQYPEQAGHFFNSDMDNAGGYGSDLFSVFLMLKKPLVIDCKGQNYASITYNGMEMDTYEWAAYAKKQRYDGVIFENISDGVGYDDLSKLTTDYVVFDSNRIKSADAIEYDNDNNVIPISQRFDPRKNDIRFSARKGENDAAQAVLEQENARL